MASEKRDSKEQNNHNENDSNGTPKFCDFADYDLIANGSDENEQTQSSPMSSSPPIAVGSPRQSLFTSTPEKDKRRRSSTWHTKIERRRRKNSSNQSSVSSSVMDDSDIDDLNGNSISEVADSPPTEYSRQKRHSWWNIFVPDNIKQRYTLMLNIFFIDNFSMQCLFPQKLLLLIAS